MLMQHLLQLSVLSITCKQGLLHATASTHCFAVQRLLLAFLLLLLPNVRACEISRRLRRPEGDCQLFAICRRDGSTNDLVLPFLLLLRPLWMLLQL